MSNKLNLMVGDWVQSDGKLILVFHLDSEMGEINRVNYGSIKNIQPLPLTPDLMERIEGFKRRGINHDYIFGNIRICFCWDNKFRWVSSNYDLLDDELVFEYLHELQQLIRLFCKKEIEVKWEK